MFAGDLWTRGDEGNNQRIASLYEEAGINKSINNFRFISCETGEVGKRE
jgi:hypothetical protein